jgi:hypothetical protein
MTGEKMKKLKELSEREINIMNEAFMIGRIYAHGGEKRPPADIHIILMDRCKRIA